MKSVPKKDQNICTPEELLKGHKAHPLTLDEVLSIICSPEHLSDLQINSASTELTDGERTYPIIKGIPALYPDYLTSSFLSSGLKLDYYDNSRLQYFLLSQIKQRGETNAPSSSIHYQRHLYRIRKLLENCKGTLLDVGCDDAEIGVCLIPKECNYIGLEPFPKFDSSFRILGLGECLPFKSTSLDAVLFNTSLDHILDYFHALTEAHRVLRIGGMIYLSTLIWEKNSSLLSDSVHFHHFKRYEIDGALEVCGFRILDEYSYNYKNDEHRYGLYLVAEKRN